MESIDKSRVQEILDRFLNRPVYLHLETTNGAYAAHFGESKMTVGAYIRNGLITVERAVIAGERPYRVGLKMELGWVYAEGLTDFEVDLDGRLLLAGHDEQGRLAVAMELSDNPFEL